MKKKVSIKKLIKDVILARQEIDRLNKLLDSRKRVLSKYFDKSGESKYSYNGVTAYQIDNTRFEFDLPALSNQIDHELLNEFIDKTYVIDDFEMFKRIMKKFGVSLRKLSGCIRLEKKVNNKKLDALIDRGDISIRDLKGCYKEKGGKSVGFRLEK